MQELRVRMREYTSEILGSWGRHAGSQLSAAIAYRVLFSLVPFATLLLLILDAVLEPTRREQFVQWLFGVGPGTDFQSSVENALAESGASTPIVGLIALVTLLWGASGTMASFRIAFRVIWGQDRGPEVRPKQAAGLRTGRPRRGARHRRLRDLGDRPSRHSNGFGPR